MVSDVIFTSLKGLNFLSYFSITTASSANRWYQLIYAVLERHWVSGAGFMAAALLAIAPVVCRDWPIGLTLIFLHSPGYMIHQLEEHLGDRFRTMVNRDLFAGRDALTTANVILVNVGYVWGANLAALFAACFFGVGWGLVAPYLVLINAASHIGQATFLKKYNPGLATSLLIFIPLAATTFSLVPGHLTQHALGLTLALAIHAIVFASVVLHAKTLTDPVLQHGLQPVAGATPRG